MKNFEEYLNEALKKKKKDADKPEEPVRMFSVGDILIANTTEGSKIPDEVADFLKTYPEYEVLEVKENGKLNLGCKVCHNEDGKEKDFLFSPKRFRKKGEEAPPPTEPKKKKKVDPYAYRQPLDDPDDENFEDMVGDFDGDY